jgi:hypothetical protein
MFVMGSIIKPLMVISISITGLPDPSVSCL